MGFVRRLLGRVATTLGCLVIVALVVAVVGGLAAVNLFLERQEPAPADAVRNFLRAVDEDDARAAHGRLCTSLQRRYTPDAFARYFSEDVLDEIGGRLGGWNVDDFPYPRGEGRHGIYFEARGVRLSERRFQVIVIRENDAWRLCEFQE